MTQIKHKEVWLTIYTVTVWLLFFNQSWCFPLVGAWLLGRNRVNVCTAQQLNHLTSGRKCQGQHICYFLTALLNPHKRLKQLLFTQSVCQRKRANIFRAERKDERWELKRGWVLHCAGKAAKIHYLSVLYLFHMLLLSNLSLQILDSENKQMDQSCRLLQPNAPLQTPQSHTAAVLPRGWGQKYMDEWMYKKTYGQEEFNKVANSPSRSTWNHASLILSAF